MPDRSMIRMSLFNHRPTNANCGAAEGRLKAQFAVLAACLSLSVALAGLAPVAGHAADEEDSPGKSKMAGDHYYLVLGPVLVPDYEGSDDYELQPLAFARWIRRGAYVEFRGDTLSANVIPASLFQAGPMVRWHRSRKDVGDSRVARMRDVSGALEAGAFVAAMLRDPAAPTRRLGLRLQFFQDVSGSYDGNHAAIQLEGGLPLADNLRLDAELFSGYGNGNYMETYFSVDSVDAQLSGLGQFDAEPGFKDAGLRLMLSYELTDHWGMGMIGTYRRMLGDAGDSPVVSDAGSRDQLVGGLLLTWRY